MDCVGKSRKWPVLLTFSTVVNIVVSGSEKFQKYSDVIYGWSPDKIVNKDSTNKPP